MRLGYLHKFLILYRIRLPCSVKSFNFTFNSGLPAIFIKFRNVQNKDLILRLAQKISKIVFPRKILRNGILIDDKSDEDCMVEIRYADNEEGRRIINSAIGKPYDLPQINRRS